ncbi:MAG: GWxTD domain-containing protein [Bacteroidetes bacterium]|nr:GWxTD domain-containing protein [Bacteroidota bacterium]
MKKIALGIFLMAFLTLNLQSKSIRAYLSYSVFNTPDNKPYVETYLTIQSGSIAQVLQENGNYSGKLHVQIIFRQNDSIINFGKYILSSPEVEDTLANTLNFLDVQRYALPVGTYDMELTLDDPNSPEEPNVSNTSFNVYFPEDKLAFSDIQFLSSYEKDTSDDILNKHGYKVVPYVFNYFPEEEKALNFYTEIYNSDKSIGEDAYVVYSYIRPFEVDKKLDQFFYLRKMNAKSIDVMLNTIDIKQLPTGNYLLVLEARDRNNELVANKELFFFRDNPGAQFNMTNVLLTDASNTFVDKIDNRDTLALYIDYLYPISTSAEKMYVKSQINSADVDALQKYFYNFWYERDNLDPEGAWNSYLERVYQANHNFKTVALPGYLSDRGRVYLQYGSPNAIAESYNEPAAFPYEIWHYYDINGQRDKKFVFYTQEMATNDFRLLHSDVVGELANYHWQRQLYSRTWDPYSIDDVIVPNSYGSFATDYYLQPR